jgi:hypothetical protein
MAIDEKKLEAFVEKAVGDMGAVLVSQAFAVAKARRLL